MIISILSGITTSTKFLRLFQTRGWFTSLAAAPTTGGSKSSRSLAPRGCLVLPRLDLELFNWLWFVFSLQGRRRTTWRCGECLRMFQSSKEHEVTFWFEGTRKYFFDSWTVDTVLLSGSHVLVSGHAELAGRPVQEGRRKVAVSPCFQVREGWQKKPEKVCSFAKRRGLGG